MVLRRRDTIVGFFGYQHRAPNLSTEFQLVEYLDSSDNDSASVCNVMVLVCFELMTTLDTVLFFFLALGLFDYLLGVFQFHLAAPYEIVWGGVSI